MAQVVTSTKGVGSGALDCSRDGSTCSRTFDIAAIVTCVIGADNYSIADDNTPPSGSDSISVDLTDEGLAQGHADRAPRLDREEECEHEQPSPGGEQRFRCIGQPGNLHGSVLYPEICVHWLGEEVCGATQGIHGDILVVPSLTGKFTMMCTQKTGRCHAARAGRGGEREREAAVARRRLPAVRVR